MSDSNSLPAHPQSEEFKKAAEEVKNLKTSPDQNTMLKLYGLFKQGSSQLEGAPSVGMFDMKGKAKRRAWEDVAKTHTYQQAQKEYIELVERLKSEIGMK